MGTIVELIKASSRIKKQLKGKTKGTKEHDSLTLELEQISIKLDGLW